MMIDCANRPNEPECQPPVMPDERGASEFETLLREAVEAEFAVERAEDVSNESYLAFEDAARLAGVCDPFAMYQRAKKDARATREREEGRDAR